jgi:hypothetical protein
MSQTVDPLEQALDIVEELRAEGREEEAMELLQDVNKALLERALSLQQRNR